MAACAALNAKVAAGVIGCFYAGIFDTQGVPKSLWQVRLAQVADDTQGMIDQLLCDEPPAADVKGTTEIEDYDLLYVPDDEEEDSEEAPVEELGLTPDDAADEAMSDGAFADELMSLVDSVFQDSPEGAFDLPEPAAQAGPHCHAQPDEPNAVASLAYSRSWMRQIQSCFRLRIAASNRRIDGRRRISWFGSDVAREPKFPVLSGVLGSYLR